MNEDTFNMQVRKFLKKVGINSQREIERAVREAIDAGQLSGSESLAAKVTLSIDSLGLSVDIEDTITLE